MSRNLGVVGHGRIGSALGQLFSENAWNVEIFDAIPDKCTVVSLKQLAEESEFIIIATPSNTNRDIAYELLPHVAGKLPGTVAKGVEQVFVTMHEVLEDVSGGKFEHGILHGPMLATEITESNPATIIFASDNMKWSADFGDDS